MTTDPTTSPDEAAVKPRPPEVGETFHFVEGGMSLMANHRESSGFVSRRSEQMVVNSALLDANRNVVTGQTPLDLLHDEDGQVQRFGRVLFRAGPFPSHELATKPGDVDHEDARAKAKAEAHAIHNAADRQAALADIEMRFGKAPSTSKTMATFGVGR